MKDEQKEAFRKWTTFVLSTGALLITCLRDPLALTFRATVQEQLRQELARNQSLPGPDTKVEKRLESEKELLKIWDNDILALREKISVAESNNRMLAQISNRLDLIELKLDLLRGCQGVAPLLPLPGAPHGPD